MCTDDEDMTDISAVDFDEDFEPPPPPTVNRTGPQPQPLNKLAATNVR